MIQAGLLPTWATAPEPRTPAFGTPPLAAGLQRPPPAAIASPARPPRARRGRPPRLLRRRAARATDLSPRAPSPPIGRGAAPRRAAPSQTSTRQACCPHAAVPFLTILPLRLCHMYCSRPARAPRAAPRARRLRLFAPAAAGCGTGRQGRRRAGASWAPATADPPPFPPPPVLCTPPPRRWCDRCRARLHCISRPHSRAEPLGAPCRPCARGGPQTAKHQTAAPPPLPPPHTQRAPVGSRAPRFLPHCSSPTHCWRREATAGDDRSPATPIPTTPQLCRALPDPRLRPFLPSKHEAPCAPAAPRAPAPATQRTPAGQGGGRLQGLRGARSSAPPPVGREAGHPAAATRCRQGSGPASLLQLPLAACWRSRAGSWVLWVNEVRRWQVRAGRRGRGGARGPQSLSMLDAGGRASAGGGPWWRSAARKTPRRTTPPAGRAAAARRALPLPRGRAPCRCRCSCTR
jgi:hypothetical protein